MTLIILLHQKHDPWKKNLMSILFLKFKTSEASLVVWCLSLHTSIAGVYKPSTLQNILLRKWKGKPQSAKKYL